jgi:hypothetical protein
MPIKNKIWIVMFASLTALWVGVMADSVPLGVITYLIAVNFGILQWIANKKEG